MAWTATWTDPAELDEASIDHAHDLREAINERYDIANALETPSVSLTKPTMCTDNGTLHLWTKATIRDQVTTALAALAPSFVDTTDSVASASAVGRWANVADIITNGLSETAETKPGELDADDFAWFSQQKRILDLMKWTRHDIVSPADTNIEQRTGSDTTWALAKTAFNAASWTSAGSFAQQLGNESGGTYTATRGRADTQTTSDKFDYPTISDDWEVTPSTRQPKKTYEYVAFFLANGTYDNPDYSAAENEYGVVYSNATGNTDEDFIFISGSNYVLPESDGTTHFKIGGIDTVTVSDPGVAGTRGWLDATPSLRYILYKWDVTDGLNKVA